ncbi:2-C-methyl-D-erythritol 2,4-cyclodiphosphate synthase [Bacteroidota bacterium]
MIPRVGIGYDVHKLGKDRNLCIGGIIIPHNKGCIAHSDGDVLIHAICDALLGAAGKRDIGIHFPDTSEKYKDIDSKILLKKVNELIKKEDFKIGNIDSVICLEKPKIKEYIPEMINTLATLLEISPEQIAIKPTTTETLGFIGAEQGISAYATVLIFK